MVFPALATCGGIRLTTVIHNADISACEKGVDLGTALQLHWPQVQVSSLVESQNRLSIQRLGSNCRFRLRAEDWPDQLRPQDSTSLRQNSNLFDPTVELEHPYQVSDQGGRVPAASAPRATEPERGSALSQASESTGSENDAGPNRGLLPGGPPYPLFTSSAASPAAPGTEARSARSPHSLAMAIEQEDEGESGVANLAQAG